MPFISLHADYVTVARSVRSDGELVSMLNALGDEFVSRHGVVDLTSYDADELNDEARKLISALAKIK